VPYLSKFADALRIHAMTLPVEPVPPVGPPAGPSVPDAPPPVPQPPIVPPDHPQAPDIDRPLIDPGLPGSPITDPPVTTELPPPISTSAAGVL
jgi:hypothetical protein